jgi:hypothetical protein
MHTTLVEIEFYHYPTKPADVPKIAATAGNGYLLRMVDGSLKHAWRVANSFSTSELEPIQDDLVRAWTPLESPIASC